MEELGPPCCCCMRIPVTAGVWLVALIHTLGAVIGLYECFKYGLWVFELVPALLGFLFTLYFLSGSCFYDSYKRREAVYAAYVIGCTVIPIFFTCSGLYGLFGEATYTTACLIIKKEALKQGKQVVMEECEHAAYMCIVANLTISTLINCYFCRVFWKWKDMLQPREREVIKA